MTYMLCKDIAVWKTHPLSWTTVESLAVTGHFLPISFRKAAADKSVMSFVTYTTLKH